MSTSLLSLTIASITATVVSAAPPDGVLDPPPSIRHQLDEAESKQAAFDAFRRARGAGVKSWADELPTPVIDVESYELDIDVDPEREILSGTVTVVLRSLRDGLAEVELDADLGLRILSVLRVTSEPNAYDTPVELGFEHSDDVLRVALPEPLDRGRAATLQITYGGHARRSGLIGATGVNWHANGATPVIHTFAQPYGARVWWPCNDRPDDKALVTLRVTVPEDLDVASNGLETERADNGDGTATSVWISRYPVPTYLVVVHVSDFVYSESTYTGTDGTTMPVGLWAMPAVAAQAEADLAVTVPQIEVMADRWGEYPFIEEKYGNATVFFGGGMEHQTMTTLAVDRVGDPWMEWLNVHELGHQWWGDWVTMDDWRHIWLNEGFATHTEWLWAEHLGPDVLAQYLLDEDWRGWFSGPVFDNPVPFSWTIYAKGSWVAWMLRHVVGDDAFFAAMASYRAANAGATGTTDELEDAMEAAAGMELDWFFDQWVYGAYRPRYVYDWSSAGNTLQLTVRQVQRNTGLFRMPMTVRATTAVGPEDHRVWIEAVPEQTIEIALSGAVDNVELNPDSGVLCDIAHISEPDLDLGPDFPDGYDFGLVPGSATATKVLPLSNTGGADLVVDGVWLQSGTVFRFVDPPAFPLTIAPGATEELTIRFDPAGLGRAQDVVIVQSNDPDRNGNAFFYVVGRGSLIDQARLATPTSVTIGRAPVGGAVEGRFDAINLGGEPLPVEVAIVGDGFHLGSSLPPALPPGSTNAVIIRFHPTTVGDMDGAVVFHQGDPAAPLATVLLSGVGEAAPRLDIDPPALSLGIGPATTTATLRLRNTGSEPLSVAAMPVPEPFRIADSPDLPFQIPAGTSAAVTIGVRPDTEGSHRSHLTLYSDDPAVPVARVPLQVHVTGQAPLLESIPATASGPGLGDSRWRSRAWVLNYGDEPVLADLVFRPGGVRDGNRPDAGIEIQPGRQRVIDDIVAATGAAGVGGVNLRFTGSDVLGASRTFAAGSTGSYGQFIPAIGHADALSGVGKYVLVGLDGNDGFHTNVGVLNLTDAELKVDLWLHDAGGALLGTRRITAAANAFAQVVSVIGKTTDETVRGGYATLSAVDSAARYLAYASVVDDASHDPTLVLPQPIGEPPTTEDIVIPSVASLPGAFGTLWRSRIDIVNGAAEGRMVSLEYYRSDGSSITGMAMPVPAGATMRFDDVVGGLFGEQGKGWLRITADGPGIHAGSRTYNDDPGGTFGQLVPCLTPGRAATGDDRVLLPALSSRQGFRTNVGLTSLAAEDVSCTVAAAADDGAALGELVVVLPAQAFVQIERLLTDELGHTGDAWAEVSCGDDRAVYFAHASVVDGQTGDPTFIPGTVLPGRP